MAKRVSIAGPGLHVGILMVFLVGTMAFWRFTATDMLPPPPREEALIRATEEGDISRVADLLNAGVSPNTRRNVYRPPNAPVSRDRYIGTPLLHIAVRNGRTELARLLLSHGADVNIRGSYGYTALHLAAGNGNITLVRFLLENHANPNAREKIRGETPLHRAAFWRPRRGKIGDGDAVVRLLLAAGADPKATDYRGRTPQDYARRP